VFVKASTALVASILDEEEDDEATGLDSVVKDSRRGCRIFVGSDKILVDVVVESLVVL
jgi:hypothetical protein